MLKGLVECKLPTNFLIIEDTEEVGGEDLFVAFLKNHAESETIKALNLICYENPSRFYLDNVKNSKITSYNFFSDPCGWNSDSAPKSDLSRFTSNPTDLSETVFFIDSLSFLVTFYGFYTVYKNLNCLKQFSKKVVCLAHGDLFTLMNLEDLKRLSSAYVKVQSNSGSSSSKTEKIVDILYKKSASKIINQPEIVSVKPDFKVFSQILEEKPISKPISSVKNEMESLTTFKLGLEMSDNERKAKNELILPYLRTEGKGSGEIIYYQDAEDDLEEDPDDDLDI